LEEIKPHLQKGVHVVSLAANVTLENIGSVIGGKITRVMPGITSEVGEGVSLMCYNSLVGREDVAFIEGLFSAVGTVKVIAESAFGSGADLTSCSPGFFAAMMAQFIEAGSRSGPFSREDVQEMVLTTLYATAKLLREKHMTPEELVSRVATKGGITEEGVKVLDAHLPSVFDAVFKSTREKRQAVCESLKKDFKD
jgi:pyrroline-5-carboxylate reductase